MASVQMEAGKHTTKQATSGNIPHDFRERENYANEDIDKSRTHLNQTFGCQTGKEAREKLLKRIAECDAVHPPKRVKADRKTVLEMNIPDPREGLDEDKLRKFYRRVYEELEDLFGKENVIYGVTHFDEIHKYMDIHDKKIKISRSGMHVSVVPWTDGQDWIDEKYKSGLNMNNFYRRNLPTLINKRLDACCQQVFGFDYQDGTGKKGKESVEALKEASAELEQKRDEYSALSAKIEDTRQAFFDEVQEQGEQLNNEINLLNDHEKTLVEAVSSITGNHYDYDPENFDFDAIMQDFGDWSEGVKRREKALDKRERASEEREASLDEREASLDEQLTKYQLDLQVLEAREEAINAKEEALDKQKEVELKQERRRLRDENRKALDREIQRLQEENKKKEAEVLKNLGVNARAFRQWQRLQTLEDDTSLMRQGYDHDSNGLILR